MDELQYTLFDEVMLEHSFKWVNDPEIQSLIQGVPVTRQEQREWFEKLPTRNNFIIWGIRCKEIPVGAFGIKNISGDVGEYWGYIGDKAYWGMGIGSWMMKTVIMLAREKKLKKLYLKVLRNNHRAVNLYLKWGFDIKKNECNDELIIMEKKIQ